MKQPELFDETGGVVRPERCDACEYLPGGVQIFRPGATMQFVLQLVFDLLFQFPGNIVAVGDVTNARQGLAALEFTVKDTSDPVEVGGNVIYDVEVVNSGTKADTNVRVAAQLPDGLQPVKAEGAAAGAVNGQTVVFEPLASLPPNSKGTFRIHARCVAAGNHRVRVQLSSDDTPQPVAKEEITKGYSDQ